MKKKLFRQKETWLECAGKRDKMQRTEKGGGQNHCQASDRHGKLLVGKSTLCHPVAGGHLSPTSIVPQEKHRKPFPGTGTFPHSSCGSKPLNILTA